MAETFFQKLFLDGRECGKVFKESEQRGTCVKLLLNRSFLLLSSTYFAAHNLTLTDVYINNCT